MPRDYATQDATAVRRADRAVEDEAWIKQMLDTAPHGALATVHAGQPFINTNLFAYDAGRHAIYLHTARIGRTAANVAAAQTGDAAGNDVEDAAGAAACFSVSEMGRLLPADEALEFSVEYAGVTAFGTICIVEDAAEAEYGLQLLLDKYAPHLRPGRDYRPITAEELRRTAVYRLDISQWSGKRKAAEAGFPGAFFFEERERLRQEAPEP